MSLTRRNLVGDSGALAVASGAPALARDRPMRRIATEEGFSVPELIDAIDGYMARHGDDEPGLRAMIGTGKYPRWPRLLDPEVHLRNMARSGVDMQVILVNSPGVQIFDAARARELAMLIVIGHNGEGIPFYLIRIDNRYRALNGRGLGRLTHSPATVFRENFWITTSGKWAPAVRTCQEMAPGVARAFFQGNAASSWHDRRHRAGDRRGAQRKSGDGLLSRPLDQPQKSKVTRAP